MRKRQKGEELDEIGDDANGKINKIEESAKQQVEKSRQDIYERIKQMRKAAERRRKDKKQKIQEIRTEMAEEFLQDSKKGDMNKCSPTTKGSEKKEYCEKNFESDANKKQDCIKDYCYSCCENEYGSMYQKLREKCYKMCEKGNEGYWSWIPATNKIVTN